MKKLLVALGIVFGLFVLAAIIVPLMVDVDKYRPTIVQVANERLNGRLELGKLSLSLWGQIKIQVAGVQLSDSQGRKVLGVKEAFFHIPFTSILGGAPLLTFKMDQPEVAVLKDKAGKLNVLTLMKESPGSASTGASSAPAPGQSAAPAPQASGGQVTVPGIAARARLGMEMRNALLTYKDEMTGLVSQTKDLNLLIKDLSLSRATEIELWANLDTKMGKTLLVRGPARLKAQAEPQLSGGKFSQLSASFKVDLNDLEISMPGLFEKKKGVDANAEGSLKATQQEARIEKFDVKFFNAQIKATGSATQLDAKTAAGAANPVVKLSVSSNEIALKPWSDLIPPLKQYELGGSATLQASVEGPADKLGYKADLALKGLTAKAPNLKTQPVIDASVKVITDQVESFLLTLKAPGNDLRVSGNVVSFTQPKITAQIASSSLNLDQLVAFPPPGQAQKANAETKAKSAPGGESGSSGKDAAPSSDLDALLDPLRENPIASATTANIGVGMKLIQAQGVKITDLSGKITLKDLTASLDSLSLGLFKGQVKSSFSSRLKPKTPTYAFKVDVAGLDLQEAVASQMAMFKNTLIGKASFKLDGNGASFNPDPAKRNLNAKGMMRVEKAQFATMDVAKMVTDGVNKALGQVGDKIPGLKGKGIKPISGKDAKYEVVSSDFTISGGKFSAPNFFAKAEANSGIDLKGSTQVGLLDLGLNARWEVIDTYNLTKARDLSVQQAGVNVEHILAEGNGPFKFPVTAGCQISAPCFNYGEVPEYLTKIALANATKGATAKVKSEVQKKVQEQVIKNPAVQNAIQGFGKKLFGR